MKRRNATRSALFTSIISLLLCVSMLVGTTFAWFTDEVKSGTNVIAAGNLDVELYHKDKAGEGNVDGNTKLFDDVTLWEPGAVVYENLTVQNKGSLALKYQLALNFSGATKTAEGKTLADVLKVAVVAGGFNGTREDAKKLAYNYSLESFALEGKMEAGAEDDVYGIVIYWAPTANDNDYNMNNGETTVLSIDLGVKLFATQLEAENDSFGPDYDVAAWEDTADQRELGSAAANVNNDGSASLEAPVAPAVDTNKTVIDAPAGTFESTDKVEVEVETTNSLFAVDADGAVVASLDVTLKVNGQKKEDALTGDAVYTVTTYISKGLTNVSVAYTGNDGKAQPDLVSYDAETGKLVFTTNHFSNYAVTGEALAYDVVSDTALSDVKAVVAESKKENSTVVIPEENKDAIDTAISDAVNKGELKQEDVNALAAAKIGDETYATLAAAFEAAEDGDTITLVNNVATSAAITNSKNVTLNLNGKTVSGTDTITGSFAIITNKAALTITGNGKMTLVATNDRGWNAYSSVISNTVGGKLVVESGTLEHLGGTDMAYAIDNLTNGKGTYAEVVINGGTIKSTYRAIRMFLNGIEAQNILTVYGGTIEGANKSIWMQDPSANANTGKLTVSKDAVLNGDVYLFVTAGSTEWPVTVSIAAEAVKGEVITGNVPDGYVLHNVNGTWTVLDNTALVSTADELVAALEAKKDVIFANDITMKAENSNGYGVTGIVVDGQTINGNGYTLKVTGASATWDSAIYIKSGSVENITVAGAMRGIFTSDAANGDIYLNNVIFSGVIYTFNSDGTSGKREGGVYITNCCMNGWTSFSDTHTEVIFTDCTFGEGSGYAFCRPYNVAKFVNCDFEEGFEIDPRAKITFENCTINGIDLTAENLATLVTSNIDNASVK